MELLKILTDDALPKEISRPVVFGVDHVESFAKNMFYTMKMSKGIGLAAPQVGQLLRIITVDTTPVGGRTMIIMINPKILESNGSCEFDEGCLSFPERSVHTERKDVITVEFQDFMGNKKKKSFSGIDSICIQHEIDHLDGVTMFQREKK
jgi:peptide deformylase